MDNHTVKICDLAKLNDNSHLDYRLINRIKNSHKAIAERMLRTAQSLHGDYALIYQTESDNVSKALSTGDDSNGDCMVIVARNSVPKTIFYRRSSQDMSKAYFNVNVIYRIK